MHWTAQTEKDSDGAALEKRLWDAADQFRANLGLKAQEYSAPALGLIFLRCAEVRFAKRRIQLLPSRRVAWPLRDGARQTREFNRLECSACEAGRRRSHDAGSFSL
jgi:hypothetical protein